MTKASNTSDGSDRFDLERFLIAQKSIYRKVLSELNNGRKKSHWMWFIFPQFDGLGFSDTAKRYAIKTLEEAQQYLDHPILGARLKECTEAVLGVDDRSILRILGHPDDLKFRSSMTLSALGIRALWKLCIDGLVFNSLEQANSINFEVHKRIANGPVNAELDLTPEGVTIN
jgi:uncharacterized protein (DUF1810 family)